MIRLLKKLFSTPRQYQNDRGILVFDNTGDVIRAERLLKEGGHQVAVMGPPPQIRTGCDLVIEFSLVNQPEILRILSQNRIDPLQAVPINNPLLEPVNIFSLKELDGYLMARAANMKITIKKTDLSIVNISGGGCPDVPYLADRLVGLKLTEAPSPNELGHTLCAYALGMAFKELEKTCI